MNLFYVLCLEHGEAEGHASAQTEENVSTVLHSEMTLVFYIKSLDEISDFAKLVGSFIIGFGL